MGVAANLIGPFVSVGAGVAGRVGAAADTISAFVSTAASVLGLYGTAVNTVDPFTSNGTAVVYNAGFIPGTIVGDVNPCLQLVIPSYLYQQYNDDEDLQAFVYAQNTLAQEYVTFMNAIGLPVYTGDLIVDTVLDWVALGLYGVVRPTLSTGSNRTLGPFNTYTLDSLDFNGHRVEGDLVYTPVDDDIFKRVLTWKLYKGDGKVINIEWLKRRIMRFLIGANGSAPNVADTQQISVTFSYGDGVTITTIVDQPVSIARGALVNTVLFNRGGFNLFSPGTRINQSIETKSNGNQINIGLLSKVVTSLRGAFFNKFLGNSIVFNGYTPSYRNFSPLPNTATFKEAVDQGVLDMPFQFKTVVNIE